MPVGLGFDIHRLVRGASLRLGGVDIPCRRRAVGHSDGDAVLHALVDALLGASGQGDIGEHFPDGDPRNRGRDSREFVREVWGGLRRRFRVVNVDLNVFLDGVHLGPRKRVIRDCVARLLGVPAGRVNVKAKTMEGLGGIGRGRAVAAQAVVELRRA